MKTFFKTLAISSLAFGLSNTVMAQSDSAKVSTIDSLQKQTVTNNNNTTTSKPCPFKNFQFSLFPFVGTYQNCNDSSAKLVSINATVGYVNAVNGVEVGGILDIVRDSVAGVEIAGVGNVVGQSVRGVQVAGVFNLTQACNGVQVAGTLNGTKQMNGIQVAGVANVSDSCKGIQASGTVNANRKMDGLSLAGVANVSNELSGLAAAGVVNVSKQSKGFMIAGVVNATKEHEGMQVAGVVNAATDMKGVQVGLINVADSIDGMQIGLVNYARKGGYHCFEFSADEVFYTNIAYRSGMKKLHAQVIAGIRPDDFKTPLWTFGWGVGTTFGGDRRVNYDIDIQCQEVVRGHHFDHAQLFKVYSGVDVRLAKSLSLAAGVSYNLFWSNDRYSPYNLPTPKLISDNTVSREHTLKSWVGAKVAIRFF